MTKKANTPIDLLKYDVQSPANKGAEIELEFEGERLGVFITILGQYSDVYVKHVRRTANKNIRRAQQTRQRGKQDEIVTIEKLDESSTELLVLCTVSWRTGEKPFFKIGSEELQCTPENVEKVYTNPKLAWIRKQVDEGITDIGNFMPI